MGPKEIEECQRIWSVLTALPQYSEDGNKQLAHSIQESLETLKSFHKRTQNAVA
jgi:hypothetical protein